MKTIALTHKSSTCHIHIGTDLFCSDKLLTDATQLANHFIIITDDTVASLYAKAIVEKFSGEKCDLLTVAAGENSKSREVKQQLEDKMLNLGCGRDTAIIAVGGGVITDLAGFIAATYCRGIAVIYIPTTLLAMVDAAIGGKTAVNTPFGKNLIGSFYQPFSIFCDINTLKTLPNDELANGLVETIKHALIIDKEFFFSLNTLLDKLNAGQVLSDEELEFLIARSCQIKCDIVTQDEYEHGMRQSVNFGHTIAHGIEILKNYHISHGQAVLNGLWVEACLSNLTGYLSDAEFTIIKDSLTNIKFHAPINISAAQLSQLKQHLVLDKKSINKQARFVLLDEIGKVHTENHHFSFPVDDTTLDLALAQWLHNQL